MKNAEALRAKAAHARRIASGSYDQLTIDRLNAFADKCERDADAMEAQVPLPAAPAPAEHVLNSSNSLNRSIPKRRTGDQTFTPSKPCST